MMKRITVLKNFLLLVFALAHLNAFTQRDTLIVREGEYWYGAAVNEGSKMPFSEGYHGKLNANAYGNQASPLLLSSQGRFIWSDKPFDFKIENGKIIFLNNNDKIIFQQSGTTLKDAYLAASKKYFPAQGGMPDKILFTSPQYNTWIELIYNQNQEDILRYAHAIIDNGFPPGALMIDDNWAPYYGRFEFRKDRFADAKRMVKELHNLGFKVMLWVCPFIRPDSEEARFLMERKWIIMSNEGNKSMSWAQAKKPAIVQWWNGFSMLMDFSNPEAVSWYQQQLDRVVNEYNVDGYKLDAGDPEYYSGDIVAYKSISPNDHTELWGKFGLKYPLNEYRAMWKVGGQPIAERLRDKNHTWSDLQTPIPNITVAGLLGYAFTCPDMIGAGSYGSFINVDYTKLDQELIVRSAQVHALMPMMQFSVAPWRVLDKEHLQAIKKTVSIREKYVPEIMKLAERATKTNEPIVSNMEYAFPHQGFENCRDQFMLGDKILVAPMLKKGRKRTVVLPKGKWIDNNGKKIKGGKTISIAVAIDELSIFLRA